MNKKELFMCPMLWDSMGGWVLCLNREYYSTIKLLDPELLNPKLNPKP